MLKMIKKICGFVVGLIVLFYAVVFITAGWFGFF